MFAQSTAGDEFVKGAEQGLFGPFANLFVVALVLIAVCLVILMVVMYFVRRKTLSKSERKTKVLRLP